MAACVLADAMLRHRAQVGAQVGAHIGAHIG